MSLSLEEKEKKIEHLKEIPDDLTTTFHFYQLAAEAGNTLAHYYLGRCYQTGRGVTVSLPDARRCFKIVVDHYPENHPQAQAAAQRLQSIPSTIPTSVVIPTIEIAEFEESEEKKLGDGGQGKVYQNKWRDEVVAVKYFSAHITEVQKQVQRLAEAKTNQSDYLMQVKALCLKPPCVVLEYISESNLSQFLGARPNIIWLHRYRLAHDIIQGVAYLHKQGLLHRDLKSINIMVIERPRLHTKLCDFDSLKKNQVGETGSTGVMTTPYYLDPRYSEGFSESYKSYAWYNEIYNLGCVLLEITTCKDLPSVHIHGNDFYIRKEQKDIPLRDSIPTNCPANFAQLIRDCLQYDATLQPRAEVLAQRMTALLEAEQCKLANTPDGKGHTPLMRAIYHRKIGKVATLLACKADVNHIDSHGWTPLFWAVQGGKQATRMTRLLLKAKADPTIVGPKQTVSVLQLILQNSLILQNELISACENGSLTKVKAAIAKGALVNLPNMQGKNPLCCAVYGMNPGVVNFVITQRSESVPANFWQACEEHNKKHYGQTFLSMEFAPVYYKDWYDLLEKIESNEFLVRYHLAQVHKYEKNRCWWDKDLIELKRVVAMGISEALSLGWRWVGVGRSVAETEVGYADYRNQIKQAIETVPLQNELIKGCENGSLTQVKVAIGKGASVDLPNWQGKNPLYCAVYGMNPDVVSYIIAQYGENSLIPSWESCEDHNKKYYGQIFLNMKFASVYYRDWYNLLVQIEHNEFLAGYHLTQVHKYYGKDGWCKNFGSLKEYVKLRFDGAERGGSQSTDGTEHEYAGCRNQIKQTMELSLQNELITACENGSLSKVKAAITKGALVNLPNAQNKKPLYCAVYGMNPEVVNYIIAQRSKKASTTSSWEACEEHNKKHYGQTFLNMKFAPKTYSEWYTLLTQIESNEFLEGHHLAQVQGYYEKTEWCVNLQSLLEWVSSRAARTHYLLIYYDRRSVFPETEAEYDGCRNQIIRAMEEAEVVPNQETTLSLYASQPTFFGGASSFSITSSDAKTTAAPLDEKTRQQLQNELIQACENGSLVKVKAAIVKGALVDLPNAQGKNPLYCAVYGMNPEVVNYVIAQRDENAPASSWQACEEHNKKHYQGQTFLNIKFAPDYYKDWYRLLVEIEPNEFLAGYHLARVHKYHGKAKWCENFEALKKETGECGAYGLGPGDKVAGVRFMVETDQGFDSYRHQIKLVIEGLQAVQTNQSMTLNGGGTN